VTARQETGGLVREVATLRGNRFGPRFHRYLYALCRVYNDAFLLGERQVGLFTLRALWDDYGYTFMYRQKKEAGTVVIAGANAELGWNRKADDVVTANLREAIMARTVLFRTPIILDQLRRAVYTGRVSGDDEDRRLVMTLRNAKDNESPDGIMAAGYSLFGADQVYLFPKPKPREYPAGTWGHELGLKPPGAGDNDGSPWVQVS